MRHQDTREVVAGFEAEGQALPFKAVFDTVAESEIISPEPPSARVHVVGKGQATHLGQASTETTDQFIWWSPKTP